MFIKVLFALVLFCSAMCKPHFVELDEEEKQLYRAAYDNYDDDDDVDVDVGVLTPKDSIWLMKAKLKEVKEFMRALCANLLSTKLKIKELATKHKLHFNKHTDKKPSYNYQPYHPTPSYQPSYEPQQPQYGHEGHYNY
ncbi:uncharacterized protein LOC121735321 [Aricia agestis]|uniref:uncharacterized protein LOC121735321 n=1 Tax=Aricia agestis TaxID=91739 RepID=UPI001C205990|nr:uncharacterized protein LOC121735321 [Aricia agestis]